MASIFGMASGKIGWRLFCSAMVLAFLVFPGTAAFGEDVSGTISVDTTWSLSESPYIVTGDVTVQNSAALTIEPGVEIQFQINTGLYIGGDYSWEYGSLSAKGTESSPIKFTSNLPSPARGTWKGIYFRDATTDVTTVLEHCIVEYGGQEHDTNIYCDRAYPAIKNCTISHSSGYPIRVEPNKMNLSGNTYTDNEIQGTWVAGGTIDKDTTWGNKGDESTYVVTGDVYVYAEPTVKLTIEPGVKIRFEPETSLIIGGEYYWSGHGSLSAKGTESSPIKFTSNSSSPVPGSWEGIYFRDTTTDLQTVLEHCIVEYGGQYTNASIYCDKSYPAVRNCTISHSSGYPIRVEAKKMNLSGNTYTDNEIQGTLIEGGTIDEDTTWGNKGDESTYVVTGDISVYTEPSAKLTIEPGVEIRFESETGLIIGGEYSWSGHGSLSAKGTASSPIKFTSNPSSPVSGSWEGIYFRDTTTDLQTVLEHCIVEYGGQSNNANIYLDNAAPAIQYNIIRKSSNTGIYVDGSGSNGAVIDCNNISDNKYGIYTKDDASPQIINNNFAMNHNAGLYNNSSGAVEAKNNWWNDAGGPNAGDTVSDNVEFDPWLTKQSDCVSDDDPPSDTYTTEATAGTNGEITPSGNIEVPEGTSQTFNMQPDSGYKVEDVLVDGVSAGAVSSYTFTNVTASHTIHVTFTTTSSGDTLSLSVTPASLNVSETDGTAAFEVANTGTGTMQWTASENADWFSISPESWTDSGTVTVTYDANDSDTERTGTVTVTAADAENSPQTVEVRQAAQVIRTAPDLIIQNHSADPTTLKAGSAISVSCEVRNQGDASSPASTIKYYLSADAVYDSGDTLLATESVDSLSVSGTSSETATLTIPSGISPGIWYLFFRADAGDEVTESNEDNNLSDKTEITLTSDPPTPPANLDARSGVDSVRLHWDSSTSAYIKGYDVYRSESADGPWTKIITEPVTGEDYEDTSALSAGTTYHYCIKTVDTFGNESEYSEVASAVFGQLSLLIPDSKGNENTPVRLPVNISNADNLNMCAVDIWMTYDKRVLTPTGVSRATLSEAYGWDYNTGESEDENFGIVRAVLSSGMNDRGPLNGEGTLFWLNFDVTGSEGDTTELEFHIREDLQAGGTSIYDCGDLNNELSLDLSDIGMFTVNWKNILCDVNGDGKVDSADAAFLMRIAVGNVELTETLLNTGDASGDGRIRSNDSAICMRIAVGDELAPPLSEAKRMSPRSSSVNVSIGNTSVSAGESIRIPIDISDTEDVAGGDIVLNYDPNLVTATDVRTTSLTENVTLDFNKDEPGQIRISFSTEDVSTLPKGSGTLLEVAFTANSDVTENSVSPLTLTSVRLNDTYSRDFATSALQTDVKTTGGSLRIKDFNLYDAILILKILTGTDASGIGLDADRSGKVGMEDVILILQDVAGTGR